MYPRDEILKYGAAPSPESNSTLAEARRLVAHLIGFLVIEGLYVIPTIPGAGSAPTIGLDEINPPLEDTDSVLLILRVHGKAREASQVLTQDLWISQFWRCVASVGLREQTIVVLNLIDPLWTEDKKLSAAVVALPGLPLPIIPGEPVLHLPAAAAEPDWNRPVGAGWYGVRVGDLSVIGTKHTAADGVVWIKRVEQSLFNSDHLGTARWEHA